ncbi:HNH endonuclease [Mucilaginibacter gracilis]|uniref:HNH endonuclease n=1 Tax=Mucilaginibacter gracilis TaxID=423350 RepID=A0A495IXP7_9SPHI|nr:HNH endonuclease [Mucilaginibacter gracilis]RKR81342.1 HNH endonuclease [Mucilaginibacter gracilis]
MSYESDMLKKLVMPTKIEVEHALLKTLFKHNGVIKEFSSGQEIVDEIANEFSLNDDQRVAFLETIYRKENRIKKSILWHRLLFRAADSLAKEKLVSRPTSTFALTSRREWMLTEDGYNKALDLLNIPTAQKLLLPTKSYEVEKIIKKLNENLRPQNYDPFDKSKKTLITTKEYSIRARGFRQAVIKAYDYKCAFCGLKLQSPNSLLWEVEAAHIVPHCFKGKDDIWNGIAFCHLHHWAFDVGWFTLQDDFKITISEKANLMSANYGKFFDRDLLRPLAGNKIFLPEKEESSPHPNSLLWHRKNRFYH